MNIHDGQTDRADQSAQPGPIARSGRWSRGLIGVALALAVVEVVSALWFATLNPIRGYDENWYLINAHRFAANDALPYAVHRPPLLPLLMAAFGDWRWLISGLSHIAATGVLFLLLRRLTAPRLTIAGVALFMICADIRLYNVLILTEMPGIFLTLLAIWWFVDNRAVLTGATCLLLFMLHWGYLSVIPAFVLVYLLQQRWREGAWYLAGLTVTAVPFLLMFYLLFGNALAPVEGSFAIQRDSVNDWWFYARSFPQVSIGLIAGGAVAAAWLIRHRRKWRMSPLCGLVILTLAIVGSRMCMLHLYESKAVRYVVPAVPALLLVFVFMVHVHAMRFRRVTVACGVVLALTLLPGKRDFYEIYGVAMDPTHAVATLCPRVAALDAPGPVYTDFNDMAVMGRTGRATVAITGDNTWHHYLSRRTRGTRDDIPDGALYLTWDPRDAQVIDRAKSPRSGTLYLVRWHAGEAVATAGSATR